MIAKRLPWLLGAVLALPSALAAVVIGPPFAFSGSSLGFAAFLAFFATLAVLAWLPRRWLWTETELLTQAFRQRHAISEGAAQSALSAITQTHDRASAMRRHAKAMRDDIAAKVHGVADRLDTAALEIFYTPDRHRQLRSVLVRAELVEDATKAHARLRARRASALEDTSRSQLTAALEALEGAFDETELRLARGLLYEVEVASQTAEDLLKPRGTKRSPQNKLDK